MTQTDFDRLVARLHNYLVQCPDNPDHWHEIPDHTLVALRSTTLDDVRALAAELPMSHVGREAIIEFLAEVEDTDGHHHCTVCHLLIDVQTFERMRVFGVMSGALEKLNAALDEVADDLAELNPPPDRMTHP